MTEPIGRLASVQIGPIAPLGPRKVPSGFVKQTVAGRVSVRALGLKGDAQADLRVHGGPEKAVYGYAAGAYPLWQADFPELAPLFVPGGVGENLTIAGVDEAGLHIGDIMRIGSAVLQITQPRQPCFKFALRFHAPKLPKAMTRNGRSGWYYRVLDEGAVEAGDAVTLIERPNPAWPVARFNAVLAMKAAASKDLAALVDMPGLAQQWRKMARESLTPG